MSATTELRQRREDTVREHMESENRHEFDITLETFDHPRYELIGTGEVHDGPEEVMAYFDETRTAFPDQRNELLELHHTEEAVIVEAMLYGTHDGPLRGLPPTGRKFEMQFCRRLRLRGGPAGLRAGLLRPGQDPPRPRCRPRPDERARAGRDRRQSPADGRAGAGSPGDPPPEPMSEADVELDRRADIWRVVSA